MDLLDHSFLKKQYQNSLVGPAPFSEPLVVKQPRFTRVEETTLLCNQVNPSFRHDPGVDEGDRPGAMRSRPANPE
jgi:hypothetical protein